MSIKSLQNGSASSEASKGLAKSKVYGFAGALFAVAAMSCLGAGTSLAADDTTAAGVIRVAA